MATVVRMEKRILGEVKWVLWPKSSGKRTHCLKKRTCGGGPRDLEADTASLIALFLTVLNLSVSWRHTWL